MDIDKWKDIQLKIDTGDTQGALESINDELNTMGETLMNNAEQSDEATQKYAELQQKLAQLKQQSADAQNKLGGLGKGLSKMGGFGKVVASALIGIGKAAKIAAASLKALAASTVILLAIHLY